MKSQLLNLAVAAGLFLAPLSLSSSAQAYDPYSKKDQKYMYNSAAMQSYDLYIKNSKDEVYYSSVEPEGSTYYIYTSEHLNWVSYMVRQGHNFYGCEIKLMNDIDFEEASFTPIGTYYTNFNGVFNGSGYAIKNAKIDFPNYWGIGFIGFLGCNGVVKDLTIASSCKIAGYGNVGAVVGCNCAGKVKHCCNYADVYAVSDFAGGIVGYNMEGSKVYKCAVWLMAKIESGCKRKVGRFIGDNYSSKPKDCENFLLYPW